MSADKPWPFPPQHVMPDAPNGAEKDRYYCLRCEALLRIGTDINIRVRRCPEYRTIGGRVGRRLIKSGTTARS